MVAQAEEEYSLVEAPVPAESSGRKLRVWVALVVGCALLMSVAGFSLNSAGLQGARVSERVTLSTWTIDPAVEAELRGNITATLAGVPVPAFELAHFIEDILCDE